MSNRKLLAAVKPPPAPSFHHAAFWQELFIYFWVFSLVGHFLELTWAPIESWLSGSPLWHPSTYTILPLAPPYGLGVVAVILIVLPLIRKHNLHVLGTFILSVLVSALVEYICATLLIWATGSNYFWDYSHRAFNLQGRVCLENCLLFGFSATVFLYFIYPFCEKFFRRLTRPQLEIIFWSLFSVYALDWLVLIISQGHSKTAFENLLNRSE